MTELTLVRHGETEWSKSGQHTSITDLDLTEHGVEQAKALRSRLYPDDYGLILASPRLRAQRTAQLAGFNDFEVIEDLAEWFYGDFEGLTPTKIRESVPQWRLWFNGAPGGESGDQVRARLTRVMTRVRESGVERAICFAHGHALRVLALCWLDFPLAFGQNFPLQVASVSTMGYEKESPAIIRWNS